jgi:hypothetical protein
MKNNPRALFLVLITFTLACTGAKEVTTNKEINNSSYPAWYVGFEFNSDSTSFTSRATAVAVDSETAQIRAENEARALLESYIAKELEDIRTELERDGSTIVKSPKFIMMLRNAHLEIEESASIVNSESIEKEGIYRGFAKVGITKKQVSDNLRNGFSSNSSYWREFSGSKSYQDLLK